MLGITNCRKKRYNTCWASLDFFFFLVFLIFNFLISNWSIVDLQCVNFCCTAKWFSYTYIYILFYSLFHYGLSQDIEYSCLCCTVGPWCLSIFYVTTYIFYPQPPTPSLPSHLICHLTLAYFLDIPKTASSYVLEQDNGSAWNRGCNSSSSDTWAYESEVPSVCGRCCTAISILA